ncbi:predicted protein [Ostreococcus lucimarinus CCE9901]|mgnify:FL=1|jgi:16S rRNA G966 N2-methylase RsmD|uniref:Uncharacterized protein n=2 Tax=Ostreococcus sp. 'lucimarinus' TaxID=242159 RepID=A4RQM2_OSTLU|nr:predicted protein [Ostreococcus lucimarinus CCE9901]ABO93704.1 predicted protein [Ostreococcus lucimarinus CCE9901]|tara:strand:+ start:10977 stop:11606 length:630 start_codon:yes stop_codon:yes gene_type:complete|eukprot:XP_001415412.1 predicted protein [Ostreococcus lucimarinus CCE9901]
MSSARARGASSVARGARATCAAKKRVKPPVKRGDGRATELEPASLMDVEENHALEQFYYDDSTLSRLMTIARTFERPLFMCNPSLASAWERDVGTACVLLDCDLRFKTKIKGFRAFDLRRPFQVRFPYDVVFVDPPFANVSPAEVKRAVDLIAATEAQRAAPCYIAYNSDREEALLESFEDSMRIGRALGYKSVKENTQAKIHLYGPKV